MTDISESVPLTWLYAKFRGVCWLCRKFVPFDEASRDHILPKSLGGKNDRNNLALAHKSCNTKRGNGYKDIHFVHFDSVDDDTFYIRLMENHGLIARLWADKKNGGYNLLISKKVHEI